MQQFKQPVMKLDDAAFSSENKKVVFTIGVSASGKSTWANQHINNPQVALIERDNIRKFIYTTSYNQPFKWSGWKWNMENQVDHIQHFVIGNALISTTIRTIVISDTNLKAKSINQIITACEVGICPITYYYKLFDVDMNEAIKRDSNRVHSVGEEVIEKQFNMLNQLKLNYKIHS